MGRVDARSLAWPLLVASMAGCALGPSEPANATDPAAAPASSAGAAGPPEPAYTRVPSSSTARPAEEDTCSTVWGSDVAAFDALDALLDEPAPDAAARESVAALFDQAAEVVEAELAPLPPGPLQDAVADYLSAQRQQSAQLRTDDALTTDQLLTALADLERECGLG